jgi:twitching motility protein PilT
MTSKDLFLSILSFSSKNKFPDIHINSGHLPIYRNHNWEIENIKIIETSLWNIESPILTKGIVREIISFILWEKNMIKFELNMEYDTSYLYENWDRYRINCYKDNNGYSIALRIIPSIIPNIEELGLWEKVKELCIKSKWLILITGPTGSWKSTNLASMIDYINKTQKRHIITIEDPIEFSFKSDKCLINQREIWSSTKWFTQAIKSSLREDPDIIVVWEMRDPETIKAVLTLAETGHLVLSTLHTNDSVQTVDRIVDIFPTTQQKQIRMQLAMSLICVLSQRLIPRADKEWRIAAREMLIANDAAKNLIISWKTHQLYSVLEIGQKDWMILMDKYLTALYNKKIISKETLFTYIRDKESAELLID